MSKRDRHNAKRRKAAKARRRHQAHADRHLRAVPEDDEPDLIEEIAAALDQPGHLLTMASSLLDMTDPRNRERLGAADESPDVDAEQLVHTFLDVARPETAAMLQVIATFAPDWVDPALLRAARSAAERQAHALPDWLNRLADARVGELQLLADIFGDEDTVALLLELPDGAPVTVTARVFNHGSPTLIDGIATPQPAQEFTERMEQLVADEPTLRLSRPDPPTTRGRLESAIEVGAMTWPPYRSETWPAARPLLEWALTLLPPAVPWPDRDLLDDHERGLLVDEILDSPQGRGLSEGEDADILDTLLWMVEGYGPGDPVLVSALLAERILLDLIPRKVMADQDHLRRYPTVLRALIRFGHDDHDVPAEATLEVLAQVDEVEGDYLEAIGGPRAVGGQAILDMLGLGDYDPEAWQQQYHERMAEERAARVGGQEALDGLDAQPLPDDALPSWPSGLDEGLQTHLQRVALLTDLWCEEVDDVELRTACRRLLGRIAESGALPWPPRDPAQDAIAVLWLLGRANSLIGTRGDQWTIKRMAAHLQTQPAALAQRGRELAQHLGFTVPQWGDHLILGDPGLLVAAERRRIIHQRDHAARPGRDG